MQTITKLITLSIASVAMFTACSSSMAEPKPIDEQIKSEITKDAEESISIIAGAMQKTLFKKAKEGGLSNAAEFCSTNAQALAKESSKKLKDGIKLKRITDKPRNQHNQATKEQLVVLEELKAKLAKGEKAIVIKQKDENHYQVYKPIVVMAKCLNCHGTEVTRSKGAYDIISQKYPNDKAIDYKLYDFRGAFLVDIVK